MRPIPFGHSILVRPVDSPTETESGLYIPEEKRKMVERPGRGEVMEIGDDVSLTLKDGDIIFFDKYKAIEVEVSKGVTWICVNEEDLRRLGGKFIE